MLKQLWQWLKRLIQRRFKNSTRELDGKNRVVKPRKLLTDTEYEALFLELLTGVNEGWTKGGVKGFLAAKDVREAELLAWLRRFGEGLLASSASNNELATRMVLLRKLDIGEVGYIAHEIGMQLLRREEEINSPGLEEVEQEEERETNQSTQDEAEVWFNQGNQQYEVGDFLGAIISLDKALAIQPDFYQAWGNRGFALSNLGRNEEAIESYDKAITIQPDLYYTWCNRGVALSDLGRNEEALVSYDKALAIQPDLYQAWYKRGNALSELGRNEEALVSYDKALAIQPDLYQAWYNRGVALRDLGRHEEAIASYDKALAIQPDFYQAWGNRGIALRDLGRNEEALVSYDKVLAIQPDDYQAWYYRGIALSDLGRNEEALVSYDKVLAIQPDDYQAWYYRGIALSELGRNEEALVSYDKALAIQPDDYQAWGNRGIALSNLGRNEEAIASYDKALAIQPDDYQAWKSRGNALRDLGRNEKALVSYDKALAIQPDDYQAWSNRGIALGDLGRNEEALVSFDKALAIQSDLYQAWGNRGLALSNLGRKEEAVASYDKALAIQPNVYQAWDNRGNALSDLGRNEEAIASYDKAIAIKPDFYDAWHGRGIAAKSSVSCDRLLSLMSPIAKQNPALNQRGYEGALVSYEEGLKHCLQETHPEGWGQLHKAIGNAHYFQGYSVSHPRFYWRKAVNSYNQALKTLTEEDFPELHLEVLQKLIGVFLDLGYIGEAEELGRRGTDLLRRLLGDCQSPGKKKQLEWKLAGFQQLTVDIVVQLGNWSGALELAEQGKNICLSWLLDGWSDETSSPSYGEIQQLLNSSTAVVYWHISPYALHTFIIKNNAPSPIILSSPPPPEEQDFASLPTAVRRGREFEDWVKDWSQQYSDYRKSKSPQNPIPKPMDQVEREDRDWRDNLPNMLEKLSHILDIPAIVQTINQTSQPSSSVGEELKEKSESKPIIQNLILIPHRDLHRFPLHMLFPDELTITYLPSAQIGINIQQQASGEKNTETFSPTLSPLLSVEHPTSEGLPPLEFAEFESEAICQIFPNCTRIPSEQATKEAVQNALPQGYGIFHFTGHGTYNFHDPALSYLALADADKLTLTEIYKQFNLTNQVNLKTYRVVSLAACETAITGNHTIISEYLGLASSFMACGVAHVISTLWEVESAASALVMIQFYQRWQHGKPEAVALAEATQWLRNVTNAELAEWYAAEIAKIPTNQISLRRFLSRRSESLKQKAEPTFQPYNDFYCWAAFTITGMPS